MASPEVIGAGAPAAYREAMHALPAAMFLCDAAGLYVDVNPAAARLIGRPAEEIAGRPWQELTWADDLPQCARVVGRVLGGESAGFDVRTRFLLPDGRASALYEVHVVPLRDGAGRITGLAGQIVDLAGELAAEARLQAAFERAPIGMALLSGDGRYLAVNRAFSEMIGYAPAELLELTWQQLTPPADLALELADAALQAAARSEGGRSWQKRYLRRDGTPIWVDITCYGVYDGEGRLLHQFAQYQDVTQQLRVAEALRASEERFRTAFDSSPIGMALHSPDGRRLASNPALARMTGYAPGELDGLGFGALTEPDDAQRERDALAPLLAGDLDQVTYECRLVHRSGEPVAVEVVAALVRAEDGSPLYILEQQTDVGERRRLERQLQHASKLEAIGRLAGGVAHDFNNMLLVVRGYTHLLLQRLAEDDPARAEAVEIDLAAERAARLVGQLLAFGRRQHLQQRVLDLNEVVRTSESLARRIVDDTVTLRVDLAPAVDPVRADPGQLEQAILNLVINARDALPEGGTITISTGVVRLGALAAAEAGVDAGRYSVLTVEDDGTGMDTDTSARAFEPFFTTKAMGTGTGLGLATVHGIVTQSGGGVAIDSSLGRGTAVSLYLPPVLSSATASPGAADGDGLPRGDAVPACGESIVVVEDDVESRGLVVRVLTASGYRVASFASPVDALDWLEAAPQQVDALLTDVVMPGMRGPELARRVLARHPAAQVILMSGFVDGEIPDDLTAAGARFLGKPFTPAELLDLLAELVAGTREEVARP